MSTTGGFTKYEMSAPGGFINYTMSATRADLLITKVTATQAD